MKIWLDGALKYHFINWKVICTRWPWILHLILVWLWDFTW